MSARLKSCFVFGGELGDFRKFLFLSTLLVIANLQVWNEQLGRVDLGPWHFVHWNFTALLCRSQRVLGPVKGAFEIPSKNTDSLLNDVLDADEKISKSITIRFPCPQTNESFPLLMVLSTDISVWNRSDFFLFWPWSNYLVAKCFAQITNFPSVAMTLSNSTN